MPARLRGLETALKSAAEKELDADTEERLADTYEERKPKELELAKANPPGGDERD